MRWIKDEILANHHEVCSFNAESERQNSVESVTA